MKLKKTQAYYLLKHMIVGAVGVVDIKAFNRI
jgi:hypothetical protein